MRIDLERDISESVSLSSTWKYHVPPRGEYIYCDLLKPSFCCRTLAMATAQRRITKVSLARLIPLIKLTSYLRSTPIYRKSLLRAWGSACLQRQTCTSGRYSLTALKARLMKYVASFSNHQFTAYQPRKNLLTINREECSICTSAFPQNTLSSLPLWASKQKSTIQMSPTTIKAVCA